MQKNLQTRTAKYMHFSSEFMENYCFNLPVLIPVSASRLRAMSNKSVIQIRTTPS